MTRTNRGLTLLERFLLAAGLACLLVCAAALVHRSISSREALREFDQAQPAQPAAPTGRTLAMEPADDGLLDFGLWSEKRIVAYRVSLTTHNGSALAVLRIGRLGIRGPVFEGTDDLTLNRGIGWIVGTGRPGAPGNINVGMAGHRDGFFRALKDVSLGDTMEFTTVGGTAVYAVDQIEIVTPDDVSVLRQRAAPSLTLVTCYPFYFIGDAPKRFIVHAALQQPHAALASAIGSASSKLDNSKLGEK